MSKVPVQDPTESLRVFGVRVDRMDAEEALGKIRRYLEDKRTARVFFVYAHCLNLACRDREFREVLSRAELVLNDGFGLEIAGKILGRPFPENLCGTDLLPRVLGMSRDLGKSVFLLGGRKGVAESCAEKLARDFPGISIAGLHSGYFSDDAEIIKSIQRVRPDLLLVGMGVPLQEKWIDRWIDSLPVRLAIGVGAFFDFYSGAVARAPIWMRRIRMEWLYRFALEPRRLWRRYLIGNPAFLLRLAHARFFGGRP